MCHVEASDTRVSPRAATVSPPQDGLLFGTVGAYDWEGAVLEESGRGRIVPPRSQLRPHFPPQLKNHAAYLGTGVAPGLGAAPGVA